ncbi:MAG TPA: MBL fold metallo-hydrolase [Anaerolineales bacterium]|nr:MBL fold metallo-hydrolase [Anaerolineales bacterium]
MYTQQFFVDGLACVSYLVGCDSQGVAAVIDPDREVQKYLDAARARGLTITHIIETHLHADHVSGNSDLAERTGAEIYIHEAGRAEFPHKPLREGDVLELGNVRLRVLHTPGHTPESVTLLVSDTTRGPEPWLALTGDTLFVGDIGRPDLAGAEAARGLAENLYDSLFTRLLPLDGALMIYPGHGAGSLCGKAIGAMRSSTLGYERKYNPALSPREKDDFIEYAVTDLPEQPGNHRRIKSLNRAGPRPLGEVQSRPLTIEQAIPHLQQGAVILDTRPKPAFVSAHVPGSIHLEADTQLSSRIGFIFSSDVPILLVLEDPARYTQVVYDLARVGFDGVIGHLSEDLEVWQAMGLPLAAGDIQDIGPAELQQLLQSGGEPPLVLDVREPWEYQRGHVPGAVLIPLGELSSRLEELDPERSTAVICATGNRSQSAAALLGQRSFKKIYNVLGGTKAWKQQGFEISSGS